MTSRFHNKEFDDATLAKLSIYEKYLTEWLPTFVSKPVTKAWDVINIFDFFAGPGLDSSGHIGSPIIAINVALKYLDQIQANNHTINFWFYDRKSKNIDQLKTYIETLELPDEFNIHCEVSTFKKILYPSLKQMFRGANLLFIDQFGIKEMTEKVFSSLRGIKGTDIIFFISSSHAGRFKNTPAFKKYLNVAEQLENRRYNDIHRAMCDYYRELVPSNITYYVSPFSLKKGANIHGLIFGSSHYKGLYKFLKVAWAIDPERGEGNFDIDNDGLTQPNQSWDMFKTQSRKLDAFEIELRERIISKQLRSDEEVFMFSLEAGFLPTVHAKKVLEKLIHEGEITISGKLRLGESCLKEPRKIMRD